MQKKLRILLLAIFLLCSLFVISVSANVKNTYPLEKVTTDILNDYSTVVIEEIDDIIKYDVIYDFKEANDLVKFKENNKNNLRDIKLLSSEYNFMGTVTFQEELSLDEFYKIINVYKLDISEFKIRAYDKIGNRITIGGVLDENSKIDSDMLEHFLDGNILSGVIACTININQNNIINIIELSNHNSVYTVSSDNYEIELNYINSNKKLKTPALNDVYWELEDNKLVN